MNLNRAPTRSGSFKVQPMKLPRRPVCSRSPASAQATVPFGSAIILALLAAVVLGTATAPAWGHDTWLSPRPANGRGEWLLALGTGQQFPQHQTPVAPALVRKSACQRDDLLKLALRPHSLEKSALWMRVRMQGSPASALSCHVQLMPIELVIDSEETVQAYLNEIQAPAQLRQHWQALRAQGVRWRETYEKHARIEIATRSAPSPGTAPLRALAVQGLGMDARIVSPNGPLRAGEVFAAQVLRDGLPLAGQAVQFVSDLSPLGLWRTTDAQGMVALQLPLAGQWMLRGTDLRVARDDAQRWESRFLTLAFEVLPAL